MKSTQREIKIIDAQGKAPGRIASEASKFLIGKHKTDFLPNVDTGDHVQIINAAKMAVDGKKMSQKVYYRHTTFAGGLKTKTLKQVFEKNPSDVLYRAVSRMLPKNKQRFARLKRLVINN